MRNLKLDVLVVASGPFLKRAQGAFRSLKWKGWRAVSFKTRSVSWPTKTFDYVILGSPQSVQRLPSQLKAQTAVFVGPTTAKACRRSFSKRVVLKDSHRQGLLNFFRRQRQSQASVIYISSSLSGTELPRALRKMGYRVTVRRAYETRIRPLPPALCHQLQSGRVAHLLCTSPSAFEALRRGLGIRELHKFSGTLLAIGPTTARRMREEGFKPTVSPQPNLTSLLRLIRNKRA